MSVPPEYVCASCVCPWRSEGGIRSILWNRSYSGGESVTVWVLGIKVGSLVRAASALTH